MDGPMKIDNHTDVANQSRPAAEPLLLNLDEAAERLRISARTLHSMAITGAIPSRRIGRRRLFRPADLAAFASAGGE